MLLTDPIFWIIAIFGIWTSYTDIKSGKIKNLSVILLLIIGFLINIFFTKSLINSTIPVLVNSLISLLIGILLWEFGFWSPADAKLFFALSFLVPHSVYTHGTIPHFPSFIILVNTFVPITIFYLLNSVIKLNFKFLKKESKKIFGPKPFLNSVLLIIGFSCLFLILNNVFDVKFNIVFQLIVVFLVIELFGKIGKKYLFLGSLIVLIIGSILFPRSVINFNFIRNSFVFLILFQVLRLIVRNMNEVLLTDEVKLSDLKQGMILGEIIIKKKNNYFKKSIPIANHFDILRHVRGNISSVFSGRLEETDVKKIQILSKKNQLKFNDIKIARTIPFAPFIFFGVIITYLIRGNVIFYLIGFKSYLIMYLKVLFYKLTIWLR